MKTINSGKVILIPDIHQNIGWANRILNQPFDHVVFMGDYLDTHHKIKGDIYSFKNTLEWINNTSASLGDKATWLLGNHEYSYMSTYRPHNPITRKGYYICSGWTRKKSSKVNKYIDDTFFSKIQLSVKVYDYIVSHAGFHPSHFKPFFSAEENIIKLNEKWNQEYLNFHKLPNHWLNYISTERDGKADVGSPIWMDWSEFEVIPEIKQIVGHTPGLKIRKKEGNLAIDTLQRNYVIIDNAGLTISEA